MVSDLIEKISHFFAANKALSLLLLVSITLFGLVSFFVMPKQYNPEIIRPAFVVSFSYTGSTPEEAINRVGYELVEKLQAIPGVEDILTKIADGTTITSTVIFTVGHDFAKAKVDLLSQLESHSYLASGAVSAVSIQEINPETIPVLQVVFSSPSLTPSQVREAVFALRSDILPIAGVSELTVVGGEDKAIIIDLDPIKLASTGVSLNQVSATLAGAGLRQKSGGFEGEEYVVEASLDARVLSLEEIGLLPISNGWYLRDVASVYEGVSPQRSYTIHATKDSKQSEVVLLAVSKQEGASAPVVTAEVLSVLEQVINKDVTKDLTYQVVSDDGKVAQDEILGLTTNLVTSIAIVAVILFLFLSLRAALVVLITVPLTFLMVLGIGWLFDETINRITLFALILSLGLLVDASIVVVDNIYTHLKEAHRHGRNISKAKVAAGAVREVGVGLVLSAVTSVIVFLPMNYITGMMGPYMGPISFFVPMALIASLIIAIVLTPFIATYVLDMEEEPNRIGLFFQNALDRFTQSYVRVLHKIVKETKPRRIVLWGALGAFVFSLIFPLFGLVHFQMLPKADRDQFYVYIDTPQGTAREATLDFTKQAIEIVLENPQTTSAQLFVAGAPVADFNGMFKGAPMRTEVDQATIRVNLTSASLRDESSTDIATAVRLSLANALGSEASYIRLMEEPPGPPVAATLVLKVIAPEAKTERMVMSDLHAFISGITGVVDEYQSLEAPVEELVYTLDREKLIALKVNASEVQNWFALTQAPQVAGEYIATLSGERVPLLLTLPYEYRHSPSALANLTIPTMDKVGVPLPDLLDYSYVERPATRFMEAALPVQYITAEVEGRSIVYVTIEIMRQLIAGELSGYTVTEWNLFGLTLEAESGEEVKLLWGGEWEMTLENFRDLGMAMLAALFLIYGILVAQYGSFRTPGFILVTVPLGLVGILLGFFVLDVGFGIYLTATALIGFIALIGIVVNNAIIFLEYVDQAKAEGTAFTDALIAAGAVRLRPILLTSLTTVLGSLTIASDPVWSGLAWAIIFGLSLSTFLTLVIFPALLTEFSKSERRSIIKE